MRSIVQVRKDVRSSNERKIIVREGLSFGPHRQQGTALASVQAA